MSDSWPEPVERVSAVLRAAAVDARVEQFDERTPTARDAANAVACELSQIVKTLVFVCDGAFVLALVPGDRRADERAVAAATSASSVRVAKADEVVRATGFEPGGVAPFPHREISQTLIDSSFFAHSVVWIGAGSPQHMASLPPADLARLAGARTFDLGAAGRIRISSRPDKGARTVQETEKIWMNGELVDWADANVHVGVHGLHYGTGVFEGIRCYDTPKGPAVFRLDEHLQRLHNSAKLLYMKLPYKVDELKAACNEVIGTNGLPECYLRPIAFYGYGELGVAARGNPVEVVIMSWPWAPYLGTESLKIGIRAKISSWQRVSPNVVPHVSKATGVYLNSMLAVTEANNAGYDEAILLTSEGFVADGSGENIFIVRDGVIYTPDLATGILPGITRDTIKQIAQDLGYTVVEKSIIRSDLYLADEAFMCGTAAEVTPLRSIDDYEIGVGEVTQQIQKAYLDTVRGHSERWAQWLDPVPQMARS